MEPSTAVWTPFPAPLLPSVPPASLASHLSVENFPAAVAAGQPTSFTVSYTGSASSGSFVERLDVTLSLGNGTTEKATVASAGSLLQVSPLLPSFVSSHTQLAAYELLQDCP